MVMRVCFFAVILTFACGGIPEDATVVRTAQRGDVEKMTDLLDRGGNVNALDRYKNTPLMVAAYNGDVEMVRLLLDRGADRSYSDDSGNTAFIVAETQGHDKIVELLR